MAGAVPMHKKPVIRAVLPAAAAACCADGREASNVKEPDMPSAGTDCGEVRKARHTAWRAERFCREMDIL